MKKNDESKTPSTKGLLGGDVTESANQKASLPHPDSIFLGGTVIHYVRHKGAWAIPYNRHSHPSLQWVHSRAEAQAVAVKINAISAKR